MGSWGVVALHGVYLILEAMVWRHVPVASTWEAFSFIAFALALVYLILEWRLKNKSTGVFTLAPALFFQIVSSAFVTHTTEVPAILKSGWFGLHVTAALLGYAAFALGAVYALLYLLLYRDLKGSRVGLIFQRMPSLEVLSRHNYGALLFGWISLTLAIAFGTIWSYRLNATDQMTISLLSDPKFLSTLLVWVLFGLSVAGHYLMRWPSRVLAWVSLVTFLLMLSFSFAINLVLRSFHTFT